MQNAIKAGGMLNLLSKGKSSVLQCQNCRHYARKPRWVPIAKSKMYKIFEPPLTYEQEEEEMQRLVKSWRLYSRSLWLFQREIYNEEMSKSQLDANKTSEEVDLESIFLETERDNAKVRAIREKNLPEEWKDIEDNIIQTRSKYEDEELEHLQITEQHIQSEMERLKHCIREEDLDEAIEKALATEVDYNFAIDKDGNLYKGRFNHDKPTIENVNVL